MSIYRGQGGSGASQSGTSVIIPVSQGGTGATTIAEARTNLNAAKNGANSDITQILGLERPLSVTQGGTGGTDAYTARTNIGAASSAQGALADTALQAASVATVALTGSYNDLLDIPTAGTGDVVGPASSTDGAVALFDGTTGLLLKDGVVLGTAATTDSTDYATAAQGAKADTALQSYTETDPVFVAHAAYNVTNTKISNWDTAYGWGNHASAGYLTSYTETDPVFVAHAAYNVTNTKISNWDTAYGWGNHASASYLTTTLAASTYAPLIGTGASGTWSISVTGNAGTATKLSTGRTISTTGDVSYTSGSFDGSSSVTGTATLATVNSNVGSYGSSSAIPVVTVNAKGLVTAVSTATVAGGQYFGSAATKAIAYNSQSIAENVTVTSGNSGLSAGPITISSGYSVTVESGSRWVIV